MYVASARERVASVAALGGLTLRDSALRDFLAGGQDSKKIGRVRVKKKEAGKPKSTWSVFLTHQQELSHVKIKIRVKIRIPR